MAYNKKGQNLDLLFTVLGAMAVLSILAIVVFQINSEARADLTVDSLAYNATQDIDEGQANINERAPLIGLITGFAVVLGLAGVLFVAFRR